MDVRSAVQDKANYNDIVVWFRSQGKLDADGLVLLADVICGMSEEIFESYKALCNMMKQQLQQVRRICKERGCRTAYPDAEERRKLAYAVEKACAVHAVLPEKYEELLAALSE